MKITLIALLIVLSANTALPNEVTIQMRKRLVELDQERLDFRKPKQELTQEKENERQAVIGWLYVNDGLWRLSEEIISQMNALAKSTANAERRDTEIGKRRQALAIISEIISNADTKLNEEDINEFRALIVTSSGREELIAWHKSKAKKVVEQAAPRNH
jgi:hypothetical protein